MLNDAIKLGDKLDIKRLNLKDAQQYPSKLIDIKDDIISITMPIEKSQVVILDLGSRYNVTFYTAKGLYASDAVVTRRYKVKSIYVAEMQLLKTAKKIQRREYYRFNCIIELKYCEIPNMEFQEALRRIINSNATVGLSEVQLKIRAIDLLRNTFPDNNLNLVQMEKGIVTDISGGGLRFTTTKEVDPEKELYLEFTIDNNTSKICSFGKLRGTMKSIEREDCYEHRLMFTNISDEQREDIVRFIFNQERLIRQKEKGFK